MIYMSGKSSGDLGEKEVIHLVKCPNCNKRLMLLPPNYPLCDVQCTGCSFRSQVKSQNSKPKGTLFGAGWEIMNKALKAGFMVPPLLVNFKWKEKGIKHQEIRFYPFIPKKNLYKYRLSPKAKMANYKMFNYVNMDQLPCLLIYRKPDTS